MKYLTPFRVASVLLVVFCALHTAGGMLSRASLGAASDAVFDSMQRVHFQFNGADCTWYGFWFGVPVRVALLASPARCRSAATPRAGAALRPDCSYRRTVCAGRDG